MSFPNYEFEPHKNEKLKFFSEVNAQYWQFETFLRAYPEDKIKKNLLDNINGLNWVKKQYIDDKLRTNPSQQKLDNIGSSIEATTIVNSGIISLGDNNNSTQTDRLKRPHANSSSAYSNDIGDGSNKKKAHVGDQEFTEQYMDEVDEEEEEVQANDCFYLANAIKKKIKAAKAIYGQNSRSGTTKEAMVVRTGQVDQEMKAGLAALEREVVERLDRRDKDLVIELNADFCILDRRVLKNDNGQAEQIIAQKSEEYHALMNVPELRADLIRATEDYNGSIGATEQKAVQSAKLNMKLLIGCLSRNLLTPRIPLFPGRDVIAYPDIARVTTCNFCGDIFLHQHNTYHRCPDRNGDVLSSQEHELLYVRALYAHDILDDLQLELNGTILEQQGIRSFDAVAILTEILLFF
ncbi:hypothetical protein BDB00DRAFT_880136 [Zychaea mexicana]|uniref:uncharacterized protein n=1 Tax=Zychaea mexicana TaxID=64656 RepID=UPI0022FE63BB|nr:uncharacterized protein BDB00DRAFT_880136 [Zychaea mexicana]KAI9470434.1 hypothetical protein BDB00DRAFT_880136 [Zychaea mexicana]